MFTRLRKATTENDRLDRIAGNLNAPAGGLQSHEPLLAAVDAPDDEAPAGSMEKVSSLRQSLTQRLESDPELSKPAPGAISRLRSRLLHERPDPLLIGAVGVIVVVLGLASVLLLSHRSHGGTATTQVAAIPATPELPTPSPNTVAARPRAAITAVLSTASPATPAPSPTAPVLRAANSAPFVPPPSPASAVPSPGSPALSDLVTSAASRSAIPPPGAPAAVAGAGVAAVPPPAAATPVNLAPALGNAALQAQRAAAVASQKSQSAGFAPAASSQPAPAR
jgi:hypothetical protein